MSLNPLAPAFLIQFQSSCDPASSLGISTTMNLPLAQLFCGMPSQIIPPYAPPINQHITDGTFLLSSLQLTSHSKPKAAVHQSTPEFSAFLSSPQLHRANCLQAIHKTIQQLNEQLKAENLDRQALKHIALQLQNDFALMRYLLFSDKITAAKDSATSRKTNPNPHPNLNPNPTSSAFTLPCTDDAQLHRCTPVGAMGPSRAKPSNSENAGLQPILNTQEDPPTTV